MDRFSIIVPVYNVDKYITKCIESVKNQDYTKWEMIIIDDGSSDKTFEIIEKYSKIDNRIKIFQTSHGGPSNARNLGIKQASGDFIAFLDGDDYWDIHYLKKITIIINRHNADVLCASRHYNYTDQSVEKIEYFDSNIFNQLEGNEKIAFLFERENCYPGATWNNLYRLEFIKENKIYFEAKIKLSEDTDFVLKTITSTDKIIAHDIDFYFYRKNNQNSITRKMSYNLLIDRLFVLKKWYDWFKDNELVTVYKRIAIEYFDSFILMRGIKEKDNKKIFFEQIRKDYYIWSTAEGKKRRVFIGIIKLIGIKWGIELLFFYNNLRKLIKI